MGFNVSFGKSAGDQMTQKYTSWIVTPDGRRWVDNYAGVRTPRFAVLSTLITLGGVATVEEIAQNAKMGKDVVEYNLGQSAPMLVRRKKSGEETGNVEQQ